MWQQLADWLIDWLIDWLTDWSIGRGAMMEDPGSGSIRLIDWQVDGQTTRRGVGTGWRADIINIPTAPATAINAVYID